jgi:tetratricopeptide (TPR) repeat protein
MAAAGWLDAGQAELAEKRLAELLKQEPDSPRTADLQARVLLAARRLDALETCLEGGLAKKQFTARAVADFYYRAANEQRAEGKRDDALRLLKKAEAHSPASAEILQAIAGLHAAAGRRDEAHRCYARMVELFPDAPDADEWRNAINLFEQKGGAQQ